MQITVTDQLPELNEHLTTLYQRLNGDLTPLMRGIGTLLEGSTRDRFRTKTDPDGVAWKNLSAERLEEKKGRGGILVDYGDLMRSITYHASSQSVAVGTDRHYGKYHQTGTYKADGAQILPERPFLGLSIDDKTNIQDLLNDFMAEVING